MRRAPSPVHVTTSAEPCTVVPWTRIRETRSGTSIIVLRMATSRGDGGVTRSLARRLPAGQTRDADGVARDRRRQSAGPPPDSTGVRAGGAVATYTVFDASPPVSGFGNVTTCACTEANTSWRVATNGSSG